MAPPKKQVNAPLHLRSEGPEETVKIGEEIGKLCNPNDVICLQGTLGAGKTHFVKGLAKGLGVENANEVTSPTYVLLKKYRGNIILYHFDAYRLDHADEMAEIGCEEVFSSGGVSVIEWADHVGDCLPEEHFLLTIRIKGGSCRDMLLGAFGPELPRRMAQLEQALEKWKVDET